MGATFAERTPVGTGTGWREFRRAYNADRLGYLSVLPAVGPVVRMAANLVFVSDPALVEMVFRRTNTDFRMTTDRRLETVDAGRGDAALEAWMAARRQTRAALHRGTQAAPAELTQLVSRWTATSGQAAVVEDLTVVNLRSSVQLVLGRADAAVEAGVQALLPSLVAVVDDGTRLPGPLAMLSRRHRRARRDDDAARAAVLAAVAAPAPTGGGIVGPLADVGIDRASAANLAVAVLLAGTLVPAAAGSWVLALLAAHSQWQDEVGTNSDARHRFIQEALRLYPPTWLISRTVTDDGVYAGWRLRAGDELVILPYVSHRDPEVFPDPEAFRPDRWTQDRPGIAEYFPFGAGARRCLAAELAMAGLDQPVEQATRNGTRITGEFPRSVSTASTLFPVNLRLGFVAGSRSTATGDQPCESD